MWHIKICKMCAPLYTKLIQTKWIDQLRDTICPHDGLVISFLHKKIWRLTNDCKKKTDFKQPL